MNAANALDRCLTFIHCQLDPARYPHGYIPTGTRLAVTISRQTGSGAMVIAEKLAAYLQARTPDGECPWTVFDRNLMARVLEEHNLPERIAKFLPEDSISSINDMVDELLGLHPPTWTVIHHTTETVLHLAELGNVILIGRAASVITRTLPNVFHVRLVGSLEKRLERAQELYHLKPKEALEFLRATDRGRARYLRKYFRENIDDPLLYDLMINTDRFSFDQVARLIGEAMLARGLPAKAAAHSLREAQA